jgi:hypothetical protein
MPKADEARQAEQIWRGLNRLPGPSLLILDNFAENAVRVGRCAAEDVAG